MCQDSRECTVASKPQRLRANHLTDLRQKLAINNCSELVTNDAGDSLFVMTSSDAKFLQRREMLRG